jgi:hypothetical protein
MDLGINLAIDLSCGNRATVSFTSEQQRRRLYSVEGILWRGIKGSSHTNELGNRRRSLHTLPSEDQKEQEKTDILTSTLPKNYNRGASTASRANRYQATSRHGSDDYSEHSIIAVIVKLLSIRAPLLVPQSSNLTDHLFRKEDVLNPDLMGLVFFLSSLATFSVSQLCKKLPTSSIAADRSKSFPLPVSLLAWLSFSTVG